MNGTAHIRNDRSFCRTPACLVDRLHRQGIPRGVILDAFRYIPRDCFVPREERAHAWEDRPLPIGFAQTISQPYTVAYMLHLAHVGPGDRVLEVGTGSGYAAAILAYIVGTPRYVTTIETRKELFDMARVNLRKVGMDTITVVHGDGREGHRQHAPYDTIIVSAQAPEIPQSLIDQLGLDGRLVMPIESGTHSTMTCVHRMQDGTEITRHDPFQFVRLV